MDVNFNDSAISPLIKCYQNQTNASFYQLSKDLKDVGMRIQFTDWLIKHFSPQDATEEDFEWHSKVISQLGKNVAKASHIPSTSDVQTENINEDQLLASLIAKSIPASQASVNQVSGLINQAAGRALNTTQICEGIRDAPLPATCAILFKEMRENLNIPTILNQAISQNNLTMIQIIIDNEPDEFKASLATQDDDGDSLIALAAFYGRLEILQLIAEKAPDEFKDLLINTFLQ